MRSPWPSPPRSSPRLGPKNGTPHAVLDAYRPGLIFVMAVGIVGALAALSHFVFPNLFPNRSAATESTEKKKNPLELVA